MVAMAPGMRAEVPVPAVPTEVRAPVLPMLKSWMPFVALYPEAMRYLPVLSTARAFTVVGPVKGEPETAVRAPLVPMAYAEMVPSASLPT